MEQNIEYDYSNYKVIEEILIPAMEVELNEYQEEMDLIGSFLSECCILDRTGYLRVTSADLYREYLAWCEKNSERPYAQRVFAIHLQNKGIRKERTSKARGWIGVSLK